MATQIIVGSKIKVPSDLSRHLLGRVRSMLTWSDPSIGYKRSRGWYIDPSIETDIRAYSKKGDYYYFPRGFLERLELLMRAEGINYEIVDKTTWYKPKPFQHTIKLKPHQIAPTKEMLQWNEGILQAPCGSGKSIMGLYLACEWGQPTLLLVHTMQIMRQWQQYVEDFTGQRAGLIHGDTFDIQNINIGSVMTLANRRISSDFARYFGVVILDEAHHVPAYSFKTVLGQFYARHRLGITATPNREDGLQSLLRAVAGPVRATVDQEELIRTGYMLRPTVYKVRTNFTCNWQTEQREEKLFAEIESNEDRASLVAKVALKNKDRSVLILSRRIKHLDLIHEHIFEEAPDTRMEILTGRLKKKEREKIVRRLKKGTLNIVLATQLADEGLDVPRLDTVLLTFPTSSVSKIEQQMGRAGRTHPDKRNSRVYDFIDHRVPKLLRQAMKRQGLYRRLKYPVTLFRV